MKRFLLGCLFSSFAFAAQCSDGYSGWLVLDPINNPSLMKQYRNAITEIAGVSDDDPVARRAFRELTHGLEGLLSQVVPAVPAPTKDGALILRMGEKKDGEGYRIYSAKENDYEVTVLEGEGARGLLYAVFHLLRLIQTQQPLKNIDIREHPQCQLRMIDHWDNLDDSVERGYAGESVWQFRKLPAPDPRREDYARLLASIGINAVAINNVNSNPEFVRSEMLDKLQVVSKALNQYGIRIFMSVNFAAPVRLKELETADPLDPAVRAWWKTKAEEIAKIMPNFGGFLVKADSEGQPGPHAYGRTQSDGANMLAEAVRPHNGLIIWRAFVYERKADRAREAFDTFQPLDGEFADNVVVQIKNGPLDFQVREPASPLFGQLPNTNSMMELQITQEYLGFSTHLVYLVPQWKEVLSFDTHAKGEGSTVAKVVDGSLFGYKHSGIAGVSNVGQDRNWFGHHFAGANMYGFGRLAWDTSLSSEQISEEWIRMTFGNDAEVVRVLKEMMLPSWEIYENYTSPLGVGVICAGNHYDSDPKGRTYYTGARKDGIGFDRTQATGSGYTAQYHEPVARIYESLETCPEELLLFFHHVPWDYKMASGKTLTQHVIDTHNEGVERVEELIAKWKSVESKIDPERYGHVLDRLTKQLTHARKWRDSINGYFEGMAR